MGNCCVSKKGPHKVKQPAKMVAESVYKKEQIEAEAEHPLVTANPTDSSAAYPPAKSSLGTSAGAPSLAETRDRRPVSPTHIKIDEQENPAPPPAAPMQFDSLMKMSSIAQNKPAEEARAEVANPEGLQFINADNDRTIVQSKVREEVEPINFINEKQKSFSETASKKGSVIVDSMLPSKIKDPILQSRPSGASPAILPRFPASRQKLIQVPTFNYGEPVY